MKSNLQRAALAAVAILSAPAAFAQAVGFDSGWSTAGDVALAGGTAVLTTAFSSIADDTGLAAGALNVSGRDPLAAGADLEAFVGVAAGSLDRGILAQATEGSAVSRSFSVSAGDRLSFDWQLATRDTDLALDYAFVVIGGQRFDLGTAAAASLTASSPYLLQTAATHFEYVFQGSGSTRVALGVVDVGDYAGTTALRLDHLAVSAVPEPGMAWLLLGGLGVLGAVRRKAGRG